MPHINLRNLKNLLKIHHNFVHIRLNSGKHTVHPSAGIIVIGNEILKARVRDTNSHFICNLLYECGIKVRKISVISDNIEEIKEEIKQFSNDYTYVITSGGIGPTHDDVTYEGLAKAFDDSLQHHPKLVDIMKNQFDIKDTTSPIFKMTNIPRKSTLIFPPEGSSTKYPCVNIMNVYIFPGSPIFLERSFKSLYKKLFLTDKKFAKEELYLDAREELFADALTLVSKEFPNVAFGSYPVSNNNCYKAFVTIESDDIEETDKAKSRFCDIIPQNILVRYNGESQTNCIAKYNEFLKKVESPSIYVNTVEMLKNIYRYPEKVTIFLDGSMGSIIIAHLSYLVAIRLRISKKLHAIYFQCDKSVTNAESLIQSTMERYSIDVSVLKGDPCQIVSELRSLMPQLQTLLVDIEPDNFNKDIFQNVEIKYPLIKWTDEDKRIFIKSLSLSYN